VLEEELKEAERRGLERYFKEDQLIFTVPQTAKILNRTTWWVRKKMQAGKLRAVRLDGRNCVNRAALISAMVDGI
jgi:hypothetical protein